MGIDFLNLIDLHAGLGKQVVVDFQPEGTDDGEIVGDHQIVDLLHGARRRILNGEDAVLAQALVDGVKDGFKILEVHDKGAFEDLFAGDLRIGALHPLAGYHGRLGEQLGGILDGILDGVIQRALLAAALALVAAAQFKEHGVQHPGVILHLRPCLLGDVLQLLTLPAGHQNGQAVLLFIVGNPGGHIHSLAEQTNQFVVDEVDLPAKFLNIHVFISSCLFGCCPGSCQKRQWLRPPQSRGRPGERCRGHAAPSRSVPEPAAGAGKRFAEDGRWRGWA